MQQFSDSDFLDPDKREGRDSSQEDVAGFVHDLRNPLSVIVGYADMLAEGSLGQLPPRAGHAAAAIVAKADEMSALLEGMLEMLRVQTAAERSQHTVPVDLCAAAHQAADRASARIDFTGDSLSVVERHHSVPVRADPRILDRVLDNIINNAITYGGHPGKITVMVSRKGSTGRIAVFDNGDGVPQGVRRALFRGHGRTESMSGAGLGLVLSLRLMRMMGGTLTFETKKGMGPAVVISLPLCN